MKLAEALSERKGLEEGIQALSNRLTQGALVVEGDRPAEDPSCCRPWMRRWPPGRSWWCASTAPTAACRQPTG
ncbi:protein of unknown function [Candidatus Hydrogenisulfobacillus filiaventi]|uniref:Uncharacterized protein n=1 Tax=Candidatus Hydrogenisulfobacillus filiaventi TaxID=2707344 RepID=A0A6F8ZI75_9FIRM|nr:protein of unknown function [Candidatus Hydrogenisulfobacillus filiaventi]